MEMLRTKYWLKWSELFVYCVRNVQIVFSSALINITLMVKTYIWFKLTMATFAALQIDFSIDFREDRNLRILIGQNQFNVL